MSLYQKAKSLRKAKQCPANPVSLKAVSLAILQTPIGLFYFFWQFHYIGQTGPKLTFFLT